MKRQQDKKHLMLLTDVGEILSLQAGSTDIREFLQRVTEKLSSYLNTAVCSIYLYEENSDEIVLTTTVGLKRSSVGNIRLHIGEGLVGKALKELRHIVLKKASKHPDFKHFPDAGEDPFECFLAVPIHRGVERIGVLVLQRELPKIFSDSEVHIILALTHQLAGAIENARALLALQDRSAVTVSPDKKIPSLVRGKSVCRGVKSGPAYVFRRRASLTIESAENYTECIDLEEALNLTASQLTRLQKRLAHRLPETASLISEAQLLMLADSGFAGSMKIRVEKGDNPIQAVIDVARTYIRMFENTQHAYLREKTNDVEDLSLRILRNLCPVGSDTESIRKHQVVIARKLFPSDILKLAVEEVQGIVLVGGGATSHVAILARSLKIPSVIVECQELLEIRDGEHVLVDGEEGKVYINPDVKVIEEFEKRVHTEKTAARRAREIKTETQTLDGKRIQIMSNINLLGDLDLALQLKTEGVGLYRTEFPFLLRDMLPSCEDQQWIYRELFGRMEDREVTVRTLDAGGDKMLSYFDTDGEANPELGLRSTRLMLDHPEILDDQLTAILLARNARTRVRIMFPMIASPDDFMAARQRVVACWERLPEEKRGEFPPVGMMLELPAVTNLMDEFVHLSDFFSIGTNDFVQYMLAVDRSNERVAKFYCPHHPAVLRALYSMVQPVLAAGKDISVCGEMVNDPRYVHFFVGIGIRKISIDPARMPEIQTCLSTETCSSMEAFAKQLLTSTSIREAEIKMSAGRHLLLALKSK